MPVRWVGGRGGRGSCEASCGQAAAAHAVHMSRVHIIKWAAPQAGGAHQRLQVHQPLGRDRPGGAAAVAERKLQCRLHPRGRLAGGRGGAAPQPALRSAGRRTQAFESSAAVRLLLGATSAPCAAVQIFEVQEEFSIGVSCCAAAGAAAAPRL